MFDCARNQGIELKDDAHGVVSSLKTCSFCGASRERGFAVVFEVNLYTTSNRVATFLTLWVEYASCCLPSVRAG